MQFLGNFGKIICWRPPPRGNPGSTTEYLDFSMDVTVQLLLRRKGTGGRVKGKRCLSSLLSLLNLKQIHGICPKQNSYPELLP